MGTTASGMPYPEPTDPVSQGAAAIKALALAITKPVAAAFVPRSDLWQDSVGYSAPRLTRVAGRWLFTWVWVNVAGGTFGPGLQPLGNIPAAARNSFTGLIQSAGKVVGVPNFAATFVSVDITNGDVQWFLPLATTVSAGALGGSLSLMWDAEQ